MSTDQAVKPSSLSYRDILDATESVTVHAYKEPKEWVVVLQFGEIVGAIRFVESSWKKNSANVLTHRFEEEFLTELPIGDWHWDRIKSMWSQQSTVVTAGPSK